MKTKILALLVILSFAFFSCQKQNETTTTTDQNASVLKSASIAVNDVAVSSVTQEANYETDFYSGYEHLLRQLAQFKGRGRNLFEGKMGMHYIKNQVPVVSIDTAAAGYPITITIEYGDSMMTQKGRVISGTVKIEISGDKNTDGSTRKISYIGCAIDSIGIVGTSTETFNGDNTATRKITSVSDITFTLADGTVINRVGNNVREWLKGLDTPMERDDDMIQVTGTVNVKSSNGDIYLKSITEPLIELGDCRHPVQGIVQYSQNGAIIAELNYGDGTCDNLAQLTTGGTTVDIELQGKMPKADIDGAKHKGSMDGNKGGMGGNGNNGGMGGGHK